jgi:hypothetical protein
MSRVHVTSAERGFAAYEMILLIVALTVFLAGVVLVVDEGVRAFRPQGSGSAALEEEGERVLDDLEAVVREAQVVSPTRATSTGSPPDIRLAFAADLDGTGGGFELGEGGEVAVVDGLQVVEVFRGAPRKLDVSVLDSDSRTAVVTICDSLDSLSKAPFSYQLLAGDGQDIVPNKEHSGGQKVSEVKVTIRLRIDDESERYSRVIKLREPAPLVLLKLS